MSKTESKQPSAKQYQDLGKAVADFYENGYLSKRTSLKMSFLKGIAGGLGGVIGATLVVAMLLWALSLFNGIPFIDRIVNNIEASVEK